MSKLSTFLKAHASVVNILGQIATIALDAAPIPTVEKTLAQEAVNDAVNSANNNGANAETLAGELVVGGAEIAQQVVPPATTAKLSGLAGDLSDALAFVESVLGGTSATAPTETTAGPVPLDPATTSPPSGSSNIAAAGDPNA